MHVPVRRWAGSMTHHRYYHRRRHAPQNSDPHLRIDVPAPNGGASVVAYRAFLEAAIPADHALGEAPATPVSVQSQAAISSLG